MSTYVLGQAAIVSKGAWSDSENYAILNTVTHRGGSFMAIAASSDIEPGVDAGWASYWVSMAKGIANVTVTALDSSTAQVTVTLSDGTSIVGGTYGTAAVAAGGIGTTELADGAVTTAKLADEAVTTAKIADGAITADKFDPSLIADEEEF